MKEKKKHPAEGMVPVLGSEPPRDSQPWNYLSANPHLSRRQAYSPPRPAMPATPPKRSLLASVFWGSWYEDSGFDVYSRPGSSTTTGGVKSNKDIHTLHIYIHTCIHACMHACVHAYLHAYLHTYIHTYKQRYMHQSHTYISCMHPYIPMIQTRISGGYLQDRAVGCIVEAVWCRDPALGSSLAQRALTSVNPTGLWLSA